MKKFLTVLLALSVVFTYTVGTAFASVATDQISAKATAEKTALSDAVDTALKTIVYDQDGYVVTPGEGIYSNATMISKTVVDQLGTKIKTDYSAAIDTEAKNQTIADTYDGDAIENAWADVNETGEILNVIFANSCEKALIAQYSIEKATALNELAAINASAYNPYDYTTNDNVANSDKDIAANAVAAAQSTINEIDAPTTVTAAVTAIETVKKAVADAKTALPTQTLAEQQKELADKKVAAKSAIETAAAALKTTLTGDYTNVIISGGTPTAIADAQAKLNALDTNITVVVNKYNAIIGNAAIDADNSLTAAEATVAKAADDASIALADESSLAAAIAAIGDVDSLINYAQQYAAAMKTMVNTDGTVMYNASTVDEALADVIAAIKKDICKTTGDVKTAFASTPTASAEKTALEKYKTDQKTALKAAYPAESYSDGNKAVIADLLEKHEKAIDDALDKAAVDAAVKAAKAELDAVLTTAEENNLKASVTTALQSYGYANNATGTGGSLADYFEGMAAKNPTKDYSAAKTDALEKAAAVFYDAVLAQNNPDLTQAQVNAIVKANYEAALAVIDATKSADELEEAAKAVVALINNIPSTVDASAKDVVLAALDAYDAYTDLAGADPALVTNKSTLTAAVNKLIAVEKKAVEDQISALNLKLLLGTFTLADADAVEAARTAYDAYNATYKDINGYNSISEKDLKALEAKVESLRFTDAANKINALPATITADDADAVAAAADAYAKLTDAQKKDLNPLMVAKLESAQAQIAELIAKDLETQKIAVQGTHVKINSSAAKGYIKISWNQNDNGVVLDGYEVYRSTKKTTGFKKISTFKVQKSKKYSTGLKKGTKYYYYIKGYKMVGDEKVYTHQSITVGRTFR